MSHIDREYIDRVQAADRSSVTMGLLEGAALIFYAGIVRTMTAQL